MRYRMKFMTAIVAKYVYQREPYNLIYIFSRSKYGSAIEYGTQQEYSW